MSDKLDKLANFTPDSKITGNDVKVKHVAGYEILFKKSIPQPHGQDTGFQIFTEFLPKGYIFEEGRRALPCDIVHMHNAGIPMRDGAKLYAEIYLPSGDVKVPAIVGWTPFGKGPFHGRSLDGEAGVGMPPAGYISGLETFEGVDPAWWCDHGYAVVHVDVRGAYYSEGDAEFFGNGQDSDDAYDAIEWLAVQKWCNGKVTMAGNSWLAIAQWYIAAKHPPSLACIAPWEGHGNMYRDEYVRGGVPNIERTRDYFCPGSTYQENIRGMIARYPLMNDYWQTKIAPFAKINVPAYVIAGFTNWCHPNGTFEAFRKLGTKEKWLRVHNTVEWPDLYNYQNSADLLKFFDHYMKGVDNGWEKTPRIRLSILNPGGTDTVGRIENEWPLARQELKKLYLDASNATLNRQPVAKESSVSYNNDVPVKYYKSRQEEYYADDGRRKAKFTIQFKEETEVTGYIKLHAWVEVKGHGDMDLFVRVLTLDKDDKVLFHDCAWTVYSGPDNMLRVSLRALDPQKSTEAEPEHSFTVSQPLQPGEIVPVEILFWPTSQVFHAGEKLQLIIAGYEFMGWPPMGGNDAARMKIHNRGDHIIHTGGKYDSYLLIPVIPPKR